MRPADEDEPPGRDAAAHDERIAKLVEEVEVEGEAHAEGVDARAARDQQARPSVAAVESGEAEQARLKASRHRDLAAEDGGA